MDEVHKRSDSEKTVAVYCENHMEHTVTQNAVFQSRWYILLPLGFKVLMTYTTV
jgi:hypothetical protein